MFLERGVLATRTTRGSGVGFTGCGNCQLCLQFFDRRVTLLNVILRVDTLFLVRKRPVSTLSSSAGKAEAKVAHAVASDRILTSPASPRPGVGLVP